MNVILLGPPGAGKGTQSSLLVDRDGYTHVSMGEVLRSEAERGNKEIQKYLDEGALVPADVIERIFEHFLKVAGDKILLDGVPRNIQQAHMVDRVYKKLGKKVDVVMYLEIAEEKIISRILNRWICREDDKKKILNGSKLEVSNQCSGILERRSDDNLETLKKRLNTYYNETEPLINFYKEKKLLIKIDATLTPEKVFATISEAL